MYTQLKNGLLYKTVHGFVTLILKTIVVNIKTLTSFGCLPRFSKPSLFSMLKCNKFTIYPALEYKQKLSHYQPTQLDFKAGMTVETSPLAAAQRISSAAMAA